jgi:hypothetical protein
LALGEVEHQAGERRRVDDRVLERAFKAAANQPRVERVMAVLDQDRAQGKAEERTARILELGGADQHRAVDVMALARVWVDRRAAIDEGVEEREWPAQLEALGADLQDQEGRVAGCLYVQGDELRVLERRLAADLWGVDRDLLPWDELGCAARLEVERFGAHQRASARARRAQAISSPFSARKRSTATP